MGALVFLGAVVKIIRKCQSEGLGNSCPITTCRRVLIIIRQGSRAEFLPNVRQEKEREQSIQILTISNGKLGRVGHSCGCCRREV